MKTKPQIIPLVLVGIVAVSTAISATVTQSPNSKSRVLSIMSKGKPIAEMTLEFPAVSSGAYPEYKGDHNTFDETSGMLTLSGHASITVHGVDQRVFEIKADEIVIRTKSTK